MHLGHIQLTSFFFRLVNCYGYPALYDNSAFCMFEYIFIASAIRSACITTACIYIMCEHHLPLGGNWPNTNEYRGCASYRFSKCSYY